MLIENMRMAFQAIRANRMRSLLTMLGIIIGIGSVIIIVSIGDSMRLIIEEAFIENGATKVSVWIDEEKVKDVRESDYYTIDELEQIRSRFEDEIVYIDSAPDARSRVTAGHSKMTFDFSGVDYNFPEVVPIVMKSGRFLTEAEVLGRSNHVVMDTDSAKKLFGTENAVGRTFRTTIGGYTDEYTVVGICEEETNLFRRLVFSLGRDEGTCYVPWSILTYPNDRFSVCRVYAKEDVDMEDFAKRLTAYIARIKNREEEDFYINSSIENSNMLSGYMAAFSAAIGCIAAISLLVGGIGIMNIMMVSVTERTREIGIRKALGARTEDILLQFLTESAILSAFGGLIGVLSASGLLYAVGALLQQKVVIRPVVVLVAISFAAAVGAFFGMYPARKAAMEEPIEALRYE